MTRERVARDTAEGSWDLFNQLLDSTPRGNFGNVGKIVYIRVRSEDRWENKLLLSLHQESTSTRIFQRQTFPFQLFIYSGATYTGSGASSVPNTAIDNSGTLRLTSHYLPIMF